MFIMPCIISFFFLKKKALDLVSMMVIVKNNITLITTKSNYICKLVLIISERLSNTKSYVFIVLIRYTKAFLIF